MKISITQLVKKYVKFRSQVHCMVRYRPTNEHGEQIAHGAPHAAHLQVARALQLLQAGGGALQLLLLVVANVEQSAQLTQYARRNALAALHECAQCMQMGQEAGHHRNDTAVPLEQMVG